MKIPQAWVKRSVVLMVAFLAVSMLATAAADNHEEEEGQDMGRGGPPPGVMNLQAEATEEGNFLTWDHRVDPEERNMYPNAEDPAEFRVYRQVGDEDFARIATLNARTTEEFLDSDVEEGVTYTYAVEYNDGVQSCEVRFEDSCPTVEVTAIPFFGAPILGALAAIGAVGAYAWLGRRKA